MVSSLVRAFQILVLDSMDRFESWFASSNSCIAEAAFIPGERSPLLNRSIVSFTSYFTFFGVVRSACTTLIDSTIFRISCSFCSLLCFAVVIGHAPDISIWFDLCSIIKG